MASVLHLRKLVHRGSVNPFLCRAVLAASSVSTTSSTVPSKAAPSRSGVGQGRSKAPPRDAACGECGTS